MKTAVIVFPGSNRERDLARALRQATGRAPAMLWHDDHALPGGVDLVALPGGFSYGDYLRCGAIAGRATIMDAVRRHAERGGLVLGVCNGFQILCESGLLPGVLMRNANLRFVCRMQHLRVERADTAFTRRYAAGEIIKVAIAHGEGNYEADDDTIARLEGEGLIGFRYCDAGAPRRRRQSQRFAQRHRGHFFAPRNILGMMPHPENLIDPLVGGIDGRGLFASLADAA